MRTLGQELRPRLRSALRRTRCSGGGSARGESRLRKRAIPSRQHHRGLPQPACRSRYRCRGRCNWRGQPANAAIDAGKHLIVEKPLALDPLECERLTEKAAASGLILLVGHTFLYNDSVRLVREILEQPETGDVYYLTSRRTHLGKIREDVGALWDLAAHDISIFSYLLGCQPERVCAVGGSYLREGRDDVAFLTLMYASGVVGNIQVSWVDANKIREIVLITGKRRIEFNDLDNLESVRIFEKGISIERDVDSFGEFQYRLRDGDIRSPRVERREPLLNLCLHFIECVKDGVRPRSDGENGTQVVRVLKAASESMRQGGLQVAV